jgi:3-oxoacyl-[acyl-carrier-protein] synthase II
MTARPVRDSDILAITGWGVLCPSGIGPDAFARGLVDGTADTAPESLPPHGGKAMVDFDVRSLLGRKGTSTLDRCTGMAVVACGEALTDSGIDVDESNRRRIGIALGTTMGSFKSTAEYSRETLLQDRPYLVNPILFPNTVMNRAAGCAAIWYGLKGVNATVAGGPLAFFNTLRYAANALHRGYADVMLAGGVEELTEYRTWAHHLLAGAGSPGEGAAVFVVEPVDEARAAGRHVDAEILATVNRFVPAPDGLVSGLAGCISRAIDQSGVAPAAVTRVVTTMDDSDEIMRAALAKALPEGAATRVVTAPVFGACQAADGALQAAAALSMHRDDPARDGEITLLAAYAPRGGVAATIVRGWSRVGSARE